MERRNFLKTLGAGGGLVLWGAGGSAESIAGLVRSGSEPQVARHPLPMPPELSGDRLSLTARRAVADLGSSSAPVWGVNGTAPGPLLRLRRGARVRIHLANELPEPTILHWHGLTVPEAADGHPRLAIGTGASYRYDFVVRDRPGAYWYHPHTHERTAPQTYLGIAGMIIVEDGSDEDLGLPSGAYDLPLVLQDKRLDASGALVYAPAMGPDMMFGYLGDRPFGNGVADPTVTVERTRYRLRILNASNARIFDLALGGEDPWTLVGGDGGLLAAPAEIGRLMLATGERAEVVVDFSRYRPGERVMLRSLSFELPGMMMGVRGGRMGRARTGMSSGAGLGQGAPLDLVEFVIADSPAVESPPLPDRLGPGPDGPDPSEAAGRRTFRFSSMMMSHTINGRSFDMQRVDARVPIGSAEVWTLANDSEVPHPVHIHAGQFRVLSRTGGRGRVLPHERGRKDTVLLLPGESVDVLVRFEYPGLFLLHCHNLEHEDAGMMSNFEVVD